MLSQPRAAVLVAAVFSMISSDLGFADTSPVISLPRTLNAGEHNPSTLNTHEGRQAITRASPIQIQLLDTTRLHTLSKTRPLPEAGPGRSWSVGAD